VGVDPAGGVAAAAGGVGPGGRAARGSFAPFRPYFDPLFGRPSIPMETYLRLMFLKFRYRLGYESLWE